MLILSYLLFIRIFYVSKDKNAERALQVRHDVNDIFGEKTKLGSFDADATYKCMRDNASVYK